MQPGLLLREAWTALPARCSSAQSAASVRGCFATRKASLRVTNSSVGILFKSYKFIHDPSKVKGRVARWALLKGGMASWWLQDAVLLVVCASVAAAISSKPVSISLNSNWLRTPILLEAR